eukprot:NODE_11462_length_281_cov_43.261062.p3 GENE.NODE_11462_length_281_cov_43.261062~~NODE_11462_length_281_cov_43.261062.p3  ORF type:complete len:61 (+),score=6.51 NODE_11462_length_281_cov_43.261062:3-185(+)
MGYASASPALDTVNGSGGVARSCSGSGGAWGSSGGGQRNWPSWGPQDVRAPSAVVERTPP